MMVETKTKFYNARGEPVLLSNEIARGGEGRILNVDDDSDLIAKIYHRPIDHEKATKISVMVSLKTDRLLGLTAWPVDTLHEFVGGPVSGFLMPRIKEHKDIHVLYGVKSRNAEYPEARWPFLIHVAANVARAFNVIHEHGHVIGDVNHASIVVSKRGTVRLVDCDSFQITTSEHQFLCEVGISTHLPPELQGKDLRGIVRTVDHDAFGMAVIIFQLLFMGRHPFSGTTLGPIDIPLEKAIKEHRFAYGHDAEYRQMRRPPATLSLDSVSPQIASMFEQAFLIDCGRPTAENWINALTEMSDDLQKCAIDPAHYFKKSLESCPWCEIESHSGIVLFQGSIGDTPAGPFDIVKTWMEILNVPAPPHEALLKKSSVLTTSTVTQGTTLVNRQRNYGFAAACLVFVAFCGLFYLNVNPWLSVFILTIVEGLASLFIREITSKIRAELEELEVLTETQLAEARKLQKGKVSSDHFSQALRELTAKRDQYEKLSHLRFQKVDKLREALRENQLHDFLAAQRIADYHLPEIEPTDMLMLESCGIESAENVGGLPLLEVPGLKPSQRYALEEWRSSLRGEFDHQPKRSLSPEDLASVESEISSARIKLQKELRSGAAYLKHISQQMRYSHEAGHPSLKDCLAAYFQAKEYLKEFSPKTWVAVTLGICVLSLIAFYVQWVVR